MIRQLLRTCINNVKMVRRVVSLCLLFLSKCYDCTQKITGVLALAPGNYIKDNMVDALYVLNVLNGFAIAVNLDAE